MEEKHKISISKKFNKLVDALIAKGVAKTYDEFAKATKINPGSLADIRSLRRYVTIEMIYKVKNKYNLDVDQLFDPLALTPKINPENLEEELVKLKAQNEAYLNVIKTLGGKI